MSVGAIVLAVVEPSADTGGQPASDEPAGAPGAARSGSARQGELARDGGGDQRLAMLGEELDLPLHSVL